MKNYSLKQVTACLAAALLVSLSVKGAEETAPAEKTKGKPLPLDILRDPFWPVGWEPKNFGSVTMKKIDIKKSGLIKWAEAKKKLKIIGLGRAPDGRVMTASIKDIGLAEKGDRIKITYMGLIYQWKVADISNKGTLALEQIDVKPVKK